MTNFINVTSTESEIKMKNFRFISAGFGFNWVIFHFTVIFFFGIMLKSIVLTGLFLGIGNLVAFLLDIPVGVMLRYFKAKTMFILGTVFLLIEGIIFFKFIFFAGNFDIQNLVNTLLNDFLNSSFNLILLLFCGIFYGLIREIFDVTTLSYLMNATTPDEFAEHLSKNNIFFGGGALIGLILSGIILSFKPLIAVSLLIFFVIIFLTVIIIFLDNSEYSISLKNIKDFKLTEKINNTVKSYNVSRKDLKEIFSKTKSIFINPMKIKPKFSIAEFVEHSKREFKDFGNTIFSIPIYFTLIWSLYIIIPLGILDTFIATFQVDFLNKILGLNQENLIAKFVTAYVLLGIIVIPVFVTQMFFIKLSKQFGVLKIISLGLLLSGISLILFGLTENLMYIILFGVGNSFGYAASFPLGQSVFSEKYNEHYAFVKNLKEIDSNASAGPLKMIQNLANVAGLIFGALLVAIIGFNGFFIAYGLFLIGIFIYSLKNKDKIII